MKFYIKNHKQFGNTNLSSDFFVKTKMKALEEQKMYQQAQSSIMVSSGKM